MPDQLGPVGFTETMINSEGVQRLPDTWHHREYPVLVEVAKHLDGSIQPLSVYQVAETTGLSISDVQSAGRALGRRGYVTYDGDYDADVSNFRSITGKAYVATGMHPSEADAAAALIAALREAADQTSDAEQKGRFHKLIEAATSVGTDVLGSVLGSIAVKLAGLG